MGRLAGGGQFPACRQAGGWKKEAQRNNGEPMAEEDTSREKFYLIDGHSQIFRAYWAPMTDLRAPSGEPTKATYVFANMLLSLLQKEKPDYLAVAVDGPEGPARRLELQESYKAQRERMPEDLPPQIERIMQILETAGIPVLQSTGEEADDVIATVVEKLRDRNLEILIVSRDKDLYQLLSERVKLFDPMKGEIIDPEVLERKKGFRPEQAVEIQTLTGDKVDNIPGVPGVGEKRAAALIRKYGSAEAVLAHAHELTPKLKENLLAFAEQLPKTRELVILKRDCPVEFDLEAARPERFRLEKLVPTFRELGFSRLTKTVAELSGGARDSGGSSSPSPALEVKRDFTLEVSTAAEPEELKRLASELKKAGIFAVDTEATSLRPRDAELVGISFAWEAGRAVYVPIKAASGRRASLKAVRELLAPVLSDPALGKVGQNLKFDIQVLRTAGLRLRGIAFDTMVASYLLNAERRSHGLDSLAREFLSYEPIPIRELIGKGSEQISIHEVDPQLLARYAGEDAEVALRLWKVMEPELRRSGLDKLFKETELPLVEVLADMEWRGVKLDLDLLRAVSAEFNEKLEKLRDRIWRAAGRVFNIDSPKQLAEILFDDLGLPVVKLTKTSRSTDAEVLRTLAAATEHPLPKLVLEYRELAKLTGTYVEVLPTLVSPATGRIHPSYHQTVAATGRLSSSDPNIQNIPIRTPEGRRIREAFVAEGPGKVLLTADYSQVELRILAHYSGDPRLKEAFETGQDIHSWVAAQIWGLDPSQVPRHLREQAKAVNFGIIYGQTAFGLARTLGIPRGEADRFIRAYKERFRGITRFEKQVIEQAREEGFVRTILGRRRPLPDIDSRNRTRRRQAERLAVNTVIQGSAADLIKRAMVAIHSRICSDPERAALIIQVHDELVFEVASAEVEQTAHLVEELMTAALPLSVPLKVDLAWGPSWLAGKR